MESLLLGIDAGGSKTVAWLALCHPAAEPEVLGRGAAGPANAQSVGLSQSLENLTAAVTAAFSAARLPCQTVASAVLAAAGSDSAEIRRALTAWADGISLAGHFRIVHDAWPLLAAGTPRGFGIALISGTGSLAFGRSADGRTARAGGWGFLFGDESSGYALAVAGLRAAAQAADGRAGPTRLLDAFLEEFQLDRPEKLVPAVYPLAGDRRQIAALAETVLATAAAGDATAGRIVDEAARELVRMVAAVAARLDWHSAPIPLALTGGCLINSPLLRERLQMELGSSALAVGPVAVVADPVLGAVRLARERIA
jgi:N-acetylglucosamine kinase-like BadF-type ATPase